MSAEVVAKMAQKLESERPALQRIDGYYEGGGRPLAFVAPEVREALKNRLKVLDLPYGQLIVDSLEERCNVTGFRVGEEERADRDLQRIWEAHDMGEQSQLAHQDALAMGRSFAIVWGDEDGDPRITVESPLQVITEHHPATRQVTRAIKRWTEGEHGMAVLYERDRIRTYRSRGAAPAPQVASEWRQTDSTPNPLGVVPVVPVVNRPRVLRPLGRSELANATPIIDAVAQLATNMMISSEFYAQPRRWATGTEIKERPVLDDQGNPVIGEDGQPVTEPDPTQFGNTAGRWTLLEDPESRLGQFPEASLSSYLDAIKLLTFALAIMAGLPAHYVALSATDNPASADAIRSAEAGLVSRARRRIQWWSGSWEQVMRLAVHVRDGSVPRELESLQAMWSDPETRTVAQAADAAVKLVQANIIPPEQSWEDLGYSPQQQDRMRTLRRRALLDQAAADLERAIRE